MGFFDFITRKIQGIDSLGNINADIVAKSWIVHPAVSLSKQGKVTLVTFQSISSDSKELFDKMNLWKSMFPSNDFRVVGVYSEGSAPKLKIHLSKYGVKYPVALDDNFKTSDSFGVKFHPEAFLLDKKNRLRFHIREVTDLDRIGGLIMRLLSED